MTICRGKLWVGRPVHRIILSLVAGAIFQFLAAIAFTAVAESWFDFPQDYLHWTFGWVVIPAYVLAVVFVPICAAIWLYWQLTAAIRSPESWAPYAGLLGALAGTTIEVVIANFVAFFEVRAVVGIPTCVTLGNLVGISFFGAVKPNGPSPIRRWKQRKRWTSGHCQRCGYNLTGNISGVCPECGTEVESP